MIPDINIFGKTISAYMLFALAGVFVVLYFSYRIAQKTGLDEVKMLYTMLFAFMGVIFGGHILYGITQAKLIVSLLKDLSVIGSFSDFMDWAIAIFGGSVFYGGMIGALIAAAIYLKKTKTALAPYADIGAMSIPLFHTFGRLGCLVSGCCYGIESPIGVIYNYSQAPGANGVIRFPVQLCEAIFNIALFLVLFTLFKKNKYKEKLINIYLIAYPVARFCFEFLRGDSYRGSLGSMSTSQIISIILIVLSVTLLIRNKIKNKSTV